jgi:hypothetical protein
VYFIIHDMTSIRVVAVVAVVMGSMLWGHAVPAQAAPNLTGLHDFDFEVGQWRVHHRVLRADTAAWKEYDGTASNRPLMNGWANVEDNTFNKPDGVTTHGVALRAYDPGTGEWAIWWLDSRAPSGAMDPPAKGHFEHGVGTFYSDGILNGKPIRGRLIWSHITPTSAHWEQAYSWDAGKTWETNWVMEFQRVS